MLYLFNETVEYIVEGTGRKLRFPCLVNEENEFFLPLLSYMEYLINKGLSQSHLAKVREAVRLFLEYSIAVPPPSGFGKGEVGQIEHWRHFSRFRSAIILGTFDLETAQDISGLCWLPSTVKKGNQVATLLTDFFKYLDELDGEFLASRFNPTITPSRHQIFAKSAAYEFRRGVAFLGHVWTHAGDKAYPARATERHSERKIVAGAKRLLDGQFLRLLENGFNLATHNGLRDALVAILMNKGGLRVSEALQLWVVDVLEDPTSPCHALVTVVHPEDGPCSLELRGRSYKTRGSYLGAAYGTPPRTRLPLSDPQALGWKSKFLTLPVYWFEPYWGEIFFRLWRRYLEATVGIKRSHPYAFSMKSNGQWLPLSEDAYSKAYERAIFASGLVPPGGCDMKAAGFTPHGCRHAYGDRAKNRGGLDEKVVMLMMHHSSHISQEVYTQKDRQQIKHAIGLGFKNMEKSEAISPSDNFPGEAQSKFFDSLRLSDL